LWKPVTERLSGSMFIMGLLGSFGAATASDFGNSDFGKSLLEARERGFQADIEPSPASRGVDISGTLSERPASTGCANESRLAD
jgi:hypothetical protein